MFIKFVGGTSDYIKYCVISQRLNLRILRIPNPIFSPQRKVKMSIYKKVQEACKENNISVMALESSLGFARGSIYKWDENRPSVDKVLAVSEALGKPMEYFVKE